jgi:hypothetical protein
MLKVLGSEALDYVVDEGVQIHGGTASLTNTIYPALTATAASTEYLRVPTRSNRLLILDMYLKRAMKGRINIMEPAMAVQKELMSIPEFGTEEGPFASELKTVRQLQEAILMCAGAAAQKLMMQLEHEQESADESRGIW